MSLEEPLLEMMRENQKDWQLAIVFPNPYSQAYDMYENLEKLIPMKTVKNIEKYGFKHIQQTRKQRWDIVSASKSKEERQQNKMIQNIANMWHQFFTEDQQETSFKILMEFVLKLCVSILQDLLKLEVRLFYSRDEDEIFCMVWASESNLRIQADLEQYPVQLVRKSELKLGFSAIMPYAPFELQDSHIEVRSYFVVKEVGQQYKQYDKDDKRIKQTSITGSNFRYKDKVQLVNRMIENYINLKVLMSNDLVFMYFPLHNKNQLDYLKNNWGSFLAIFKGQDEQYIRNYFGEKVGIYFVWLQFYLLWLLCPAITGLIVFVLIYALEGQIDDYAYTWVQNSMIILVSLLVSIFSAILPQLWSRKYQKLQLKWGMSQDKDKQPQRPEFRGDLRFCPISGKEKKFEAFSIILMLKRMLTYFIVVLSISIAILAVCLLFNLRTQEFIASNQYIESELLRLKICALVNALQIKLFNIGFIKLTYLINNWENYETELDYKSGLLQKMFLFCFVNSYSSLFYIAFAKWYFQGCYENDCMFELSLQLTYIYLINFIFNAGEIGIPFLYTKYKIFKEKRRLKNLYVDDQKLSSAMSYVELQSKKENLQRTAEQIEILIEYGYVVMFTPAFSLLPFLSLIIVFIEVRIDAIKLCRLYKRPLPSHFFSIYLEQRLFEAVSLSAALTNTAILVFMTNVFHTQTQWYRLIIFMLIEHLILIIMFGLKLYVNDTPEIVKKAKIWGNRIVSERIFNQPTDIDEQRELRNLHFKPPKSQIVQKFAADEIFSKNE